MRAIRNLPEPGPMPRWLRYSCAILAALILSLASFIAVRIYDAVFN